MLIEGVSAVDAIGQTFEGLDELVVPCGHPLGSARIDADDPLGEALGGVQEHPARVGRIEDRLEAQRRRAGERVLSEDAHLGLVVDQAHDLMTGADRHGLGDVEGAAGA